MIVFENQDVVMSVTKLMSRIVQPPDMEDLSPTRHNELYNDHCYGITADPMIQFACAFSALIHDVGECAQTKQPALVSTAAEFLTNFLLQIMLGSAMHNW